MKILHLDTETFSEVAISLGAHAYAEGAEVLLAPYAWGDDEPVCLDLTAGDALDEVQALINEADEVVLHNSPFDRTVLRHVGVDLPVAKIRDTMLQALQHSLPPALGALCDALGAPSDKAKDKDGRRLIQLFTKPRPKNMKLRRATRETHPEDWEKFKAYACSDIVAMRWARGKMPSWNCTPAERELWALDQIINDRGVAIDLDLARAALRAFERTSRLLAAKAQAATGGAVTSTTQRQRLLDYMQQEHGFAPLDLTKGTVSAHLREGAMEIPDEVRSLLENRQQAAATSPAKYKVLLGATSRDGRLRGTIQFRGASRTGRDAGRIFQPQNLPRPTLGADVIEMGIEAMKADCEDLVFDNVSELCASAVRGAIVAPAGRKLVVSDLSNIEGRVLAWLAGEDWKLKAFRDYDAGVGHDLYKITAGSILGKPPGEVTKAERQVSGKVPELACGFGGSVGAFATMGALYGVNLPEDEVLAIVKAWRRAHRATVSFWYDLENAARRAIEDVGDTFIVRDLKLRCSQGWLRIMLPSGRRLCYPSPAIDDDGQLSYLGVNQYTRKWERLRTYGGKLAENVTQAVAADVLFSGLRGAEAAGYGVVLRVHDELITETPDDAAFSAAGLSGIMSTNPSWAVGLPLAAAGFETHRYRKDD